VAEPLLQEALHIHRQLLPNHGAGFIRSLDNLIKNYESSRKHAQTVPLLQEAIDVARSTSGEQSVELARNLERLAASYWALGNYSMAESHLREALRIREVTSGPESAEFALALNRLGAQRKEVGAYVEAAILIQRALDIDRVVFGEEHLSTATALNNLGELSRVAGNYKAAEEWLQKALEMRQRLCKEDDPSIAASLNNLGLLYKEQGKFAAAERLLRQANSIWARAGEQERASHATAHNNLASLYWEIGDHATAANHVRQAIELDRVALGDDHPGYATDLLTLGVLGRATGQYAAVEPFVHQAISILRKSLGDEHPSVAAGLNNLAWLYRSMGNYDAARPLLREATSILQHALSEEHPTVATSFDNQALLQRAIGDHTDAEVLFRRALQIRRAVLPEDHPAIAASLKYLGETCAALLRFDEALQFMQQAATISTRLVAQVFSFGSENQRLVYLNTLRVEFDIFLSLVVQRFGGSPVVCQAAFDLVLLRKGLSAEALAAQRDAILAGRYPVLRPALDRWILVRGQIARKLLAGPGSEGPDEYRRLLEEWNQDRVRLEMELAQIPEMRLEQQLHTANRRAVARALPRGAALVELVRFDVFDFEALPAKGEQHWRAPHYLAFVLRAQQPDGAMMIDLGDAEAIDNMVVAFRSSVTGGNRSPRPVPAATDKDAGGRLEVLRELILTSARELITTMPSQTATQAGSTLRQMIFDPIAKVVPDCTRLIIAPDGDLCDVPFEALALESGRYLVDDYTLSYVTNGRDILRFGAERTRAPSRPVVCADPDFDMALTSGAVPASGFAPFGRLPGTQLEGARIADRLGVEPLVQSAVLDSTLKGQMSPSVLHVATHGFFLANDSQRMDPDEALTGSFVTEDLNRFARLSRASNPLLRSGLALAGANTWLRGGLLPVDAEDGLLTAEDVTGLDLTDTELVVLSACETGLGEVQVGEGVFGLRRAFVLAGARTLIMSVWKVPDSQTVELMDEFYGRLLDGHPRADALRQAQLELKAKYPAPYYWAAFICQGDPNPLPGAMLLRK
jgi:CHAT domain-containing protein/tetratricopeptide (TPR) repeat protein